MTAYVIGAVVATLLVAAFLLRDSDTSSGRLGYRRSGDGLMAVFETLFILLILLLIWGGGIAEFVGCVCIVLKLLTVEPVASWSWFEACLPLIGGVVAQLAGLIIREALD